MAAKRKRKSDLWERVERWAIALAPALLTFLLEHFRR